MNENSDFEISITLGLILKGTADDLQGLLNYITAHPELFLVFKRTSGGKLTIVDGD